MALSLALAPAATASSFGAFATQTPAPVLELRADTTGTSTTATGVAALTTTFTPPATCTDDLLTMLTAKSFQIWINEPLPLPGSMLGDCYPSEWIDGYTSVVSSSSSVAPMMSPLVCPSGWKTQSDDTWTSGYIACCASGFTLAPPSSAVDSDRPAYGGTCYSNFKLGQVETVTVYNATALSQTTVWTASTTPAQAYAHPIDGIAADYTPTTSSSASDASPSTGGSSASGSSSSSGSDSDSGASGLGGGDAVFALLVAGVVALML